MLSLQQAGLTRARYDSRQVASGVTVVLYYRLHTEKFLRQWAMLLSVWMGIGLNRTGFGGG